MLIKSAVEVLVSSADTLAANEGIELAPTESAPEGGGGGGEETAQGTMGPGESEKA